MSEDKDNFEEFDDEDFEEEEKPAKADKSKPKGKVAKTDAKSDAKKKKPRSKNNVAKWFREMRAELKKVIWLTPKQTLNNTVVALVMMVASGIVIWGVDQVGTTIFTGIRALLRFGG